MSRRASLKRERERERGGGGEREREREREMSAMMSLPNEMLIHILQYVDASDIPAVLSLCKRVHSLRRWIFPPVLRAAVIRAKSSEDSSDVDRVANILTRVIHDRNMNAFYTLARYLVYENATKATITWLKMKCRDIFHQ